MPIVPISPIATILPIAQVAPITAIEEQPQPIKKDDPQMDTPPSTPDVETGLSKFEELKKRKNIALSVLNEIKEAIELQFQTLAGLKSKRIGNASLRMTYDDRLGSVHKAQRLIRDVLNEIYNEGTNIASKAEGFIQECYTRDMKKFTSFELDINGRLERAQKAIDETTNALNHEIDLHQRTLLTRQAEAAAAEPDKVSPKPELEAEAELGAEPQMGSEPEMGTEPRSEDQDDCAIVGEQVAEVITVNQGEAISDLEVIDDNDTELDEIQEAFTPCQAQRPE